MALAARLLGTSAIRPWTFCEVSRTTSIDCLLPPGRATSASHVTQFAAGKETVSGLPPCPQHEVVPDPARLERAATLTDCGLGLTLTG